MEILYILSAAILWGFDGLLRSQITNIRPVLIVFWEHLIGFLVIALYITWCKKRIHFPKAIIRPVILISILSGIVGTYAFTKAGQITESSSIESIYLIQKLQPIFTILGSIIILREKPKISFWLWTFIALISSFYITYNPKMAKELWSVSKNINLQASLFALIAACGWGFSTIFSKMALKYTTPLSVLILRFGLTAFFTIPALFLAKAPLDSLFINTDSLVTLFIITLSTGMLATFIYYDGLKKIPAHIVSILELAFPVTGFMVSQLNSGFSLQPIQVVAVLTLLICMFQVVRLIK
ncbi:MAG: DMT family transporter [Patescibacteria group bacterium]